MGVKGKKRPPSPHENIPWMLAQRPAPKKHVTRHAPHMEKYVKVERYGKNPWRVGLNVGVQTFTLDGEFESKKEAMWLRDMLCIALGAMVKESK